MAVGDVNLWLLGKESFKEMLSENISLALYFNRILAERLTGIQQRIIPVV